MNKKEKEQILNLIKKCACFYSPDGGRNWRLETSINVSNPELISTLRKFLTED